MPLRAARRLALLLPLLALLVPRPAHADTPPPAVRHQEDVEAPRTEGDSFVTRYTDTPYLALRLMPIELISGIGLVGAEFKIRPDLTVITQLGAGSVKVSRPVAEDSAETISQRKAYVSADLQGRYYIVGSLGVGIYGSVDVNYTWVDTDLLINGPLINYSSGLRSGISFGGSYTSFFGLGIDMQFLVHRRITHPTPSEVSPPLPRLITVIERRLDAPI